MITHTVTFFLIHPIQDQKYVSGFLYPGSLQTPKEYSLVTYAFSDKQARIITIPESNLAGILYHYSVPDDLIEKAKNTMQGEVLNFFEETRKL